MSSIEKALRKPLLADFAMQPENVDNKTMTQMVIDTTGEEMARTECMGYGGQQELLTWGGDGKDYRASLPQDRTIYYC